MAVAQRENLPGLHRWLAVWTKPRQEERAEQNLQRQGFDVLLPRVRERRRRNRQLQWQLNPMFPRYVFVGADFSRQSIAPISSTFGCVRPVWIGGQPAYVPQTVIDELRCRCEQPQVVDASIDWEANQGLRVVGGPFAGLEAMFQARSADDRVRVLLYWLGQWQRAELPVDVLEAAH